MLNAPVPSTNGVLSYGEARIQGMHCKKPVFLAGCCEEFCTIRICYVVNKIILP
jgi:hypothetical protein